MATITITFDPSYATWSDGSTASITRTYTLSGGKYTFTQTDVNALPSFKTYTYCEFVCFTNDLTFPVTCVNNLNNNIETPCTQPNIVLTENTTLYAVWRVKVTDISIQLNTQTILTYIENYEPCIDTLSPTKLSVYPPLICWAHLTPDKTEYDMDVAATGSIYTLNITANEVIKLKSYRDLIYRRDTAKYVYINNKVSLMTQLYKTTVTSLQNYKNAQIANYAKVDGGTKIATVKSQLKYTYSIITDSNDNTDNVYDISIYSEVYKDMYNYQVGNLYYRYAQTLPFTKWSESPIITLNANGGKFSDNKTKKEIICKVGDSISTAISSYTPLRDAAGSTVYIFKGWSTNGTKVITSFGTISQDTILYAVWDTASLITITYCLSGAKWSDNTTANKSQQFLLTDGKFKFTSTDISNIPSFTISQSGYSFLCFTTNTAYPENFNSSTELANIEFTADTTVYAVWRKLKTKFSIFAQANAVLSNSTSDTVTLIPSTRLSGKSFGDTFYKYSSDSEYNTITAGSLLCTLSIGSNKDINCIRYIRSVGNNIEDYLYISNTDKVHFNVTRTKYEYDSEFYLVYTGSQTLNSTTIISNVNIDNSGISSTPTISTDKTQYSFNILSSFDNSNYYEYKVYKHYYDYNYIILVSEWTERPTLTLNANGGVFSDSTTVKDIILYLNDSTNIAASYVPTRATENGTIYTFKGWSTDNIKVLTAYSNITDNLTFYALWDETIQTFTVSFVIEWVGTAYTEADATLADTIKTVLYGNTATTSISFNSQITHNYVNYTIEIDSVINGTYSGLNITSNDITSNLTITIKLKSTELPAEQFKIYYLSSTDSANYSGNKVSQTVDDEMILTAYHTAPINTEVTTYFYGPYYTIGNISNANSWTQYTVNNVYLTATTSIVSYTYNSITYNNVLKTVFTVKKYIPEGVYVLAANNTATQNTLTAKLKYYITTAAEPTYNLRIYQYNIQNAAILTIDDIAITQNHGLYAGTAKSLNMINIQKGYTFNGWYSTSNSMLSTNVPYTITISDNTLVSAKYTYNAATITIKCSDILGILNDKYNELTFTIYDAITSSNKIVLNISTRDANCKINGTLTITGPQGTYTITGAGTTSGVFTITSYPEANILNNSITVYTILFDTNVTFDYTLSLTTKNYSGNVITDASYGNNKITVDGANENVTSTFKTSSAISTVAATASTGWCIKSIANNGTTLFTTDNFTTKTKSVTITNSTSIPEGNTLTIILYCLNDNTEFDLGSDSTRNVITKVYKQFVATGSNINTSLIPLITSSSNYTFSGWATSNTNYTLSTIYNNTISGQLTADTTYYGYYRLNAYSLILSLPTNSDYTVTNSDGSLMSNGTIVKISKYDFGISNISVSDCVFVGDYIIKYVNALTVTTNTNKGITKWKYGITELQLDNYLYLTSSVTMPESNIYIRPVIG